MAHVDGFGTPAPKRAKYRERGRRDRRYGFKLFDREDTNLMSPRQTLRLRPAPDVVAYERAPQKTMLQAARCER